jgi:peptide/nickel transport system ATP-binding protein
MLWTAPAPGRLTPSAGEILFDGQAVGSLPARALARHVQPVFQDPYSSLNPRKTVGAIIRAPLTVHRIGAAQDRRSEVGSARVVAGDEICS